MNRPEPRGFRKPRQHPGVPAEAQTPPAEPDTAAAGEAGSTAAPSPEQTSGGAGAEERTAEAPAEAPQETPKKIGRPKGTGRNVETKSRTVTIQLDILEESLNAVDYLKTNPAAPRTFTQLLDLALFEMNKKLRDEYNGGEPFPQRAGKLKPGPR
ncbi:hypothetical protein GS504_03170 [Rhodococcus hoagii]|nr:hypothetical protein [Prescottella equi]